MTFLDKFNLKEATTRHYVRVVAFGVLGVAIGALIVQQLVLKTIYTDEGVVLKGEDMATTTIVGTVLPESGPTALRIPAINLATTFEEPLGVHPDRSIEVPDSYEKVGWYKYGPTPGELGPAVILGHVDSYRGPAVFFSLGQLEPGDEIEIDREDGSTAVFEVMRIERHPQVGFPTREVYDDINHAGLRLVTCTGIYDHGTLKYSHNLIVFAMLKDKNSEQGADQIESQI